MLGLGESLAVIIIAYSVIYVVVCFGLYVAADKTGSERLKRLTVAVERRMSRTGDAVATLLEGMLAVVALAVLGFVALLPVIGVIALIEHFRN